MNFHLAWFFFCILSAAFIFGFTNFKFEKNRELTIDGLRYLLAAFVAFHHNDISSAYFETGTWKLHDPTLGYIGQFGVAVFFMITGYLFGDISKDTDWKSFFIKRFFRITPLTYLYSIICIAIATYIGITMGNVADFKGAIYWFDGGISGLKPPIYGFKDSYLIGAGVTWTLYWEWMFYLCLPLLVLFFNKKYTLGLCIAVISIFAHCVGYFKIPSPHAQLLLFFSVGVLIKNLKHISLGHSNIKSVAALITLGYCLFFSENNSAYNMTSCVLTGLFFYIIASGANFFGLLTSRGVLVLGDASYSIYLLHGIGWFVMNKMVFHFGTNENDVKYYVIQTLSWYMICFISLLTYKYLEKPFINFGRKVAQRRNATSSQ